MSQFYPLAFDVIVVGGGHAGTEAAAAAARMGATTLLLSQSIGTIGEMSCNPAIGGIAKGTLVKEVDALDGLMAKAADHAGIQFRILNACKGPAVQATRAQADRVLYKQFIRTQLESLPNLRIFQQSVTDLLVEEGRVTGVKTQMGLCFRGKAVVLTTGTFLGGVIHIGLKNYEGGRAGEAPSIPLAQRLRDLNFAVGRLKTGTPPRIDGRTINFDVMEQQPGDTPTPIFSFMGKQSDHPQQVPCFITHTTEETHAIIKSGLGESPMYQGVITGRGPRYCPSIEDKVHRFSRTAHQIFVEPEGLTSIEWYPNGISTSLSFPTQWAMVRSIPGFERAEIIRPGYAIEYCYVDPRELHPSLETKKIPALFFAGQINGTTGYEEAAGQGIVAGINAALLAQGKPAWVPQRSTCYLGVMIDDLITLGTTEPYRMFTSRAEYRLLLREDNADIRLTPVGYALGCVGAERWSAFQHKCEQMEQLETVFKSHLIRAGSDQAQRLADLSGQAIGRDQRAHELLKRPEITAAHLVEAIALATETESTVQWLPAVLEQVQISCKYAGYLDRQQQDIDKRMGAETQAIPSDFVYDNIPGLSNEVVEKLTRTLPATIGMAARIPGVTPAAISLLLVFLKRHKGKARAEDEADVDACSENLEGAPC
ncbi:MAG: tRNA uridine-5-carboxymethylaminomethyl(34) synthesis enzyme MnmG [Pseudomonadota bacterium]